ncbi:hypothetical protein V6N13_021665 [Hibiscus sabdariffa]|uniref:Uncharacterized protein n=1 Tax=Hibiscus sabdariffa TaxID=183260 RepID=A0ABR2B9T8_9ROSI
MGVFREENRRRSYLHGAEKKQAKRRRWPSWFFCCTGCESHRENIKDRELKQDVGNSRATKLTQVLSSVRAGSDSNATNRTGLDRDEREIEIDIRKGNHVDFVGETDEGVDPNKAETLRGCWTPRNLVVSEDDAPSLRIAYQASIEEGMLSHIHMFLQAIVVFNFFLVLLI